ncbi:MatE_and transmembrane domain-containing protein [Hexamita inflata]|uniref:MatE and transmembrane domain-containing protein n=1 Tax=Hexamita inflata TaxID=28002 RepID=A0AA86PVW1_9EUKA|nr:MatE and transmembrane domain-containing protein [Hexamita inflata]
MSTQKELQSQHSSIKTTTTLEPIQYHQSLVITKSVAFVSLNNVLPELIYQIVIYAVAFVLLHTIAFQVDHDWIFIVVTSLLVINVVNITLSDAIIEAGAHYMNKSLELKQYNASKVYFAYTFVVGYLISISISLGLLVGPKNQIAMYLIWQLFLVDENSFYLWTVIIFSLCYFPMACKRLLRVEGLFSQNYVIGFSFALETLYVLMMQFFVTEMLGNSVTLYTFILIFVCPLVINAVVYVFQAFHIRQKNIRYQNIHYIQKSLFKPLRFKIVGDILKQSSVYVLWNIGDALIYLFTYNVIIQESEFSVVSYSVLFLGLCNAFNTAVSNTMSSVFRINMQLKRYDRVCQFFQSAFVMFFVNLLFQVVTFSLRNVIYKQVFSGKFDSTFQFYHCSLDGLFGVFSAYVSAYIRSESNKIKMIIGSFKFLLSIAFWLVSKYTNSGNSHFSTVLNYYKYCVDLIGAGFFVLILQKLNRLRKMNQIEESAERMEPPKLVLQNIQPIEAVSRTSNTEETKSKSISKEFKEMKEVQSQSWALEDKELIISKE